MNVAELIGELNTVANGKRLMSISTDSERFVLPVTPWKYQVQLSQNNKTVDILDYGEMLVFGHRKLHRLKFSCFFPDPNHGYPFVVGDEYTPHECIELLNRFKTTMGPVHVILTDSPINQFFAINDINFREKDGSRDIEYDIDLVEYRDFNVPESNYTRQVNSITGLKDRAGVRSTASIQSFLENITRDVSESIKAITGSSGSVKSSGGSGSDAINDIASTYMAFSTGNFTPSSISSIVRVASNPIGTVKSGLKGVGNVVKSALGGVKSVIKGIGSIFSW